MSVGALEVITTADRLPVVETTINEEGYLVSMAVITAGLAVPWGRLAVEAGLMTGGVSEVHKSAVLVRGYVSPGNPARWFGRIRMDLGDRIYLECRSSDATNVRLNYRSEGKDT